MKDFGLEVLSAIILSILAAAVVVFLAATAVRNAAKISRYAGPAVELLTANGSINERLASRLRLAQNGRGTYR